MLAPPERKVNDDSLQRVLIIGCPGSGKSVLARRMAAATGLPVVHLDRHYWGDGWAEPSREEWQERLAALLSEPRWIMDGNYAKTLELRLRHADTVIVLEVSTWLCLARVVRRAVLSFGRRRGEDMAPGCPERFDWPFLAYVWRFERDGRAKITAALQGFPGRVTVLQGKRGVDALLAGIGGSA